MTHLAYLRVSTLDQSLTSQRASLLKSTGRGGFDKEFTDEGVSGAVLAAERPGFAQLLNYAREGDTLHVAAVDRLGRDALDVQTTVRALINRGVVVNVVGLGPIGRGVGELVLAVLAQMAEMERDRIRERTAAGRAAARASFEATGKTHNGKTSLGRPRAADGAEVRAWRQATGSSLSATAKHWGLSVSTVKRYHAAG